MYKATAPDEFYPELRRDYSNKIGLWGEITVSSAFDDYSVYPHLVNEDGVDIEIEGHDIGIEVWNHSRQHAYQERLESVIKNLSNYTHKFHVVSFISPEYKKIEEDNGITVVELGFQIIDEEYLDFYQKYCGLKRKKTPNKRTWKIIRNKLRPVFDVIKKQSRELLDDSVSENISFHSHVCNNSHRTILQMTGLVSSIYLTIAKGIRATFGTEKEIGSMISESKKCGHSKPQDIEDAVTQYVNVVYCSHPLLPKVKV